METDLYFLKSENFRPGFPLSREGRYFATPGNVSGMQGILSTFFALSEHPKGWIEDGIQIVFWRSGQAIERKFYPTLPENEICFISKTLGEQEPRDWSGEIPAKLVVSDEEYPAFAQKIEKLAQMGVDAGVNMEILIVSNKDSRSHRAEKNWELEKIAGVRVRRISYSKNGDKFDFTEFVEENKLWGCSLTLFSAGNLWSLNHLTIPIVQPESNLSLEIFRKKTTLIQTSS
ncbi:MAG: hypothetical protein HYS58_02730 [Elusimicrobia bacterium]|nr:hypothetical protein [Elusimicrobiota bacterium]